MPPCPAIAFPQTDTYCPQMDTPTPAPYRIGIVPLPGFALLSYASTVEQFRAANLLGGRMLYDVRHFAASETAQSSGAAGITAEHRIGDTPELDLLLVIAGGDPSTVDDPALFRWLARMSRTGAMLGGVSGGPFVLARAGLMEGRRMTVHWEHAPALAELDPGLLLERRRYLIDRDRVTCGGGTAGLDLTNALIARHHGQVFARLVADWFLHTDIRPAADPQRASLIERIGTTSQPVISAVTAMEDHIADPVSLDDLARVAGVTGRQLNRLFNRHFGTTVMRHYARLRLDTARRLLANSSLSMTNIALATGFASSSNFSRSYAQHFGEPPSAYRR